MGCKPSALILKQSNGPYHLGIILGRAVDTLDNNSQRLFELTGPILLQSLQRYSIFMTA
jgi:hypothetical protein